MYFNSRLDKIRYSGMPHNGVYTPQQKSRRRPTIQHRHLQSEDREIIQKMTDREKHKTQNNSINNYRAI